MSLGTGAWQLSSALAGCVAEQITVGALLSVTVKVVVQVALFPAASVAVTVMVCEPRPTTLFPSATLFRVIALGALQLSLTLAPPMTLGTAAWQLSSAVAGCVAEQISVGGLLSVTVKVVVQVALFPAVSVAVTVMVCEPGPTRVPGAGD